MLFSLHLEKIFDKNDKYKYHNAEHLDQTLKKKKKIPKLKKHILTDSATGYCFV
jgi:hypothetical protein